MEISAANHGMARLTHISGLRSRGAIIQDFGTWYAMTAEFRGRSFDKDVCLRLSHHKKKKSNYADAALAWGDVSPTSGSVFLSRHRHTIQRGIEEHAVSTMPSVIR
jgi:hypothetical protein